jgi:hypothetical protein
MLHPSQWATAPAVNKLKSTLLRKHSLDLLTKRLRRLPRPDEMSRLPPAELRRLEDEATRELSIELPPTSKLRFDGATTDD